MKLRKLPELDSDLSEALSSVVEVPLEELVLLSVVCNAFSRLSIDQLVMIAGSYGVVGCLVGVYRGKPARFLLTRDVRVLLNILKNKAKISGATLIGVDYSSVHLPESSAEIRVLVDEIDAALEKYF